MSGEDTRTAETLAPQNPAAEHQDDDAQVDGHAHISPEPVNTGAAEALGVPNPIDEHGLDAEVDDVQMLPEDTNAGTVQLQPKNAIGEHQVVDPEVQDVHMSEEDDILATTQMRGLQNQLGKPMNPKRDPLKPYENSSFYRGRRRADACRRCKRCYRRPTATTPRCNR